VIFSVIGPNFAAVGVSANASIGVDGIDWEHESENRLDYEPFSSATEHA